MMKLNVTPKKCPCDWIKYKKIFKKTRKWCELPKNVEWNLETNMLIMEFFWEMFPLCINLTWICTNLEP